MKKYLLFISICFAIFCNAQNNDSVAVNIGSNINDFMQAPFTTDVEYLPSCIFGFNNIYGLLVVDIFLDEFGSKKGFNIRKIRISDSLSDEIIIDFNRDSSHNITKRKHYPKSVRKHYKMIKKFVSNIAFVEAEKTQINSLNIITLRLKIISKQ